jgi:subtilisin family serine protease
LCVLVSTIFPVRANAANKYKPLISPQYGSKLNDSQTIISGLEDAQSTVRVIVNLTEPNEVKQASLWKKRAMRGRLRDRIRERNYEVLSAVGEKQFRLKRSYDNIAAFSGEVTAEGLNSLLANPLVQSVEPDRVEHLHLAQGLPLIGGTIYRSLYEGAGVAVAIVDTGIDYTHPKLGNGGFPNSKVIGGYDYGDDDADPIPNYQAHGTCCAGIAAGNIGATGDYIGGVAPAAKLYALKVTSGAGTSAYTSDIVSAWDWCITHQYDDPCNPILIISVSLGSGRYYNNCDRTLSDYADAADRAENVGITIFASSGNDGYCDAIAGPACISNIISVGAVYDAALGTVSRCVDDDSCATPGGGASCNTDEFSTSQDTQADMVIAYSNTDNILDFFAPSYKAYTTDIAGASGYNTDTSGDYYSLFGGTSASSPYAAGAAAVLQSAYYQEYGDYLSPADLKILLTATGDDVTDDKVAITKPRINIKQALESFVCCLNTVTSYPYTEDFEGEQLCGTTCGDQCQLSGEWINNFDDDIDWTVNSGPTISSSTGPTTDHNPGTSGGKYLYTESSDSCSNVEAILTSPCFDLGLLSEPELRFWYHMYGPTMGSLTVEISDDDCSSWTPVWYLSGEQGDIWQQAVVDLSAYSGSTIKLQFRGLTGSGYFSDMAIDDISVRDASLIPPQITSTPAAVATADMPYLYDVDANGLPAPVYSLIASPNDMTIDPNTGLITWTPDYFDIGSEYSATVLAENSQGSHQQSFALYVLPGDAFNDGKRSAAWQVYYDDYSKVNIAENNSRLEIIATDANTTARTLYTANGWFIEPNEDFAVRTDFHYDSNDVNSTGWIGLTVESGQQYISISAGADDGNSFYYYETIADGNIIGETQTRDANDGTLFIWYDADANSLYVSTVGIDANDAYTWQTITNPLTQTWTTPVSVTLGGGSNGSVFSQGDVYLDNFKVTSGALYKWPPVTDLNGDGFINLGDIAKFTAQWLAEPNYPADFDGSGSVDFIDFAELGLAW